jgi:peptidoglycan-N-acetylmuramic acid deacetylase
MKKVTKTICAILTVAFFSLPIISTAQDWSVHRMKNHEQPPLDSSMSYIEKYNAYYLDKKASENDKVLYLTFDAGYENGNIERILDVLKNHNAKGAFFILENLITRNTDLVKRMADEGHTVCNHTAKHKDMTKVNNIEDFKTELSNLECIYKEYTGNEMAKYYRPPEGKFNEQNLDFANKLGYKTIFWSFAYADWDNNKQPSEEYAIQKIKDNTHNGMIVLLHPTSKTNADILDRILTYWEEEGFRFGTLDELK